MHIEWVHINQIIVFQCLRDAVGIKYCYGDKDPISLSRKCKLCPKTKLVKCRNGLINLMNQAYLVGFQEVNVAANIRNPDLFKSQQSMVGHRNCFERCSHEECKRRRRRWGIASKAIGQVTDAFFNDYIIHSKPKATYTQSHNAQYFQAIIHYKAIQTQ